MLHLLLNIKTVLRTYDVSVKTSLSFSILVKHQINTNKTFLMAGKGVQVFVLTKDNTTIYIHQHTHYHPTVDSYRLYHIETKDKQVVVRKQSILFWHGKRSYSTQPRLGKHW